MLLTFNDLLKEVPLGKTALRRLLAELGFVRSAICGRLLFDAKQVEAIKGAAVCRTGFTRPASGRGTPLTSRGSGSGAGSMSSSVLTRRAARQRTCELRDVLRKPRSERPSGKVVPLR